MKKGEISTSFLIGIILTIMAGVVLVLAFTSLNWTGKSDELACKSSVLFRGSVPDAAKEYTPLNCKTEKICISSKKSFSKEECDNLFPGVDDVSIEKFSAEEFISNEKMDAKTEIEKIISKKVIECWDMMGSGKISIENSKISKSYGLGKTTSFCVICSRIDIDPSILNEYKISKENLSAINPYMYMKTRKYPGTNGSYLEYITGNGSNGRGAAFGTDSSLGDFVFFDPSTMEEHGQMDKEFKQMAIVFSQASFQGTAEVWRRYLTTAIVGGVAVSGAYSLLPSFLQGAAAGATKAVAGATGPAGGGVLLIFFALAAGAIQINVWNNQALTASYCGEFTHSEGSKKGCSVVRVMPYNATELNTFCGVIDGLP